MSERKCPVCGEVYPKRPDLPGILYDACHNNQCDLYGLLVSDNTEADRLAARVAELEAIKDKKTLIMIGQDRRIAELFTSNETLTARVAELESFKGLWEVRGENMKKLTAELAAAKSRVAELEADCKFLRDSLTGASEQFAAELAAAKSRVAELEAENDRLHGEVLKGNNYSDALYEEKSDQRKELAAAKSRVAELEAENNELKLNSDWWQRGQIEAFEIRCRKFEAALASAKAENERWKRMYGEMKNANDSLAAAVFNQKGATDGK
jgi:DNA repair exonuclease SbcCD ATPase subunit